MKTPRIVRTLVVLILAATAVLAADVSGKWVASVPGRDGQTREVTFQFNVSGDQLTGTMTTARGESQIENGKVQGDEISFTRVMEFGGNQVKLQYTGKIAGSEIRFTVHREGGERGQEFTAKRPS